MAHCFVIRNGVPVTTLESYDEMEWTRRLFGTGTLSIRSKLNVDRLSKLERLLDPNPKLAISESTGLDWSNGELTNVVIVNDSLTLPDGVNNGQRLSPIYDLSNVGIASNSVISWNSSEPSGTSVTIETNLSFDGGATWNGWQSASNNGPILGIADGSDLWDVKLQIRQTLTSVGLEKPSLNSVIMSFNGYTDVLGIREGDLIGVTDDPRAEGPDYVYIVESVTFEQIEGARSGEQIHVVGKEYGSLDYRICLPPPFEPPFSDSHHVIVGTVETAMKTLVNVNAGPGAIPSRIVPNLIISPDQGRGPSGTFSARLKSVSEQLTEIGKPFGIGWEVAFNVVSEQFEFDVIVPVDKKRQVMFSTQFDNVAILRWMRSVSEKRNLAYAGGQGEGIDRQIVKVHNEAFEPTGVDRMETFIDARDAKTVDDLNLKASQKLADRASSDTFELTLDSAASRDYRVRWDLGDIVTVYNPKWGLRKAAEIVAVKNIVRAGAGETIREISLAEEPINLRKRVLNEIGDQGSQRA